jgi:hypothetical protein
MIERKSYIGKLNGVSGIWCDQKPEDLDLTDVITFYNPDEGKVFIKDGEFFDSVVIKDGVNIEDYIEVKDPRQKEGEENEPSEM